MDKFERKKRRKFGQHFTSTDICEEFILPHIKSSLSDYIWVDLFAGNGNLILPILKIVREEDRISFFKDHIYLFDIQDQVIEEAIKNAINYGIPLEIAKNNIQVRDCIKNYPTFLKKTPFPIYHITNPPYLYLGYIVKHPETKKYLPLFEKKNKGYQDLYQLALINDFRHNIKQLIYIIPSNFIFGNSVSNKIRDDFFPHYNIEKSIIFERKIFKHTGTNVMINFFVKKKKPDNNPITFSGTKIDKKQQHSKIYFLDPKYHYKAGNEFEEFCTNFRLANSLKFTYYLKNEDLIGNQGKFQISVIDSNNFNGNEYKILKISINEKLYKKITGNPLWIRTVDTGTFNGRAGIYEIHDTFSVNGILVTKATYRTHPIQLFFTPQLNRKDLTLLLKYFNIILEFLRDKYDSEFLTTYKYSNGPYTRKYLGLSQVRKLINTFPIKLLNINEKNRFEEILLENEVEELIRFLKTIKKNDKNAL